MFVFSFRGLGFLVPVAIIAPNFVCYIVLSFFPEIETEIWLKIEGAVFILAPIFTYFLGRVLNKTVVKHVFGDIRFEHWGIIQLAIVGLIVSLVLLNELVDFLEATLPLGSWFGQNVFLFYLATLVISPIWLFIYLKKKIRKMNVDLRDL